jgi:DNA-binding MarR family transcriptional regulator
MEARDAPSRVRELPTWLLNRAAARGTRLVADRTAELGVTRTTYSLLAALDEFGPASQAELGRRLGLDRKDVSSVVGVLERDGLISRGADPRDARRKTLEITPTGTRMLTRLDDAIALAQEDLLAALPVRDRAELARILAVLADPD